MLTTVIATIVLIWALGFEIVFLVFLYTTAFGITPEQTQPPWYRSAMLMAALWPFMLLAGVVFIYLYLAYRFRSSHG